MLQGQLRPPHPIERFAYGGLSCMCAATVTNPVDVLKTRMQLQSAASTASAASQPLKNPFIHAITHLLYNDGVRGFYSGLVPSILREGTYSTLRMGLYEPIKSIVSRITHSKHDFLSSDISLAEKIVSGGLAGAVGAGIANPTDLIKVRMQACQHSSTTPSTTLAAFRHVYATQGMAGLYRGVGPTTQRAALLTASQLASYDHIKSTILRYKYLQEGLTLHFVASMAAGLVCAITTSPVDLVKSRYMNQEFDHATGKGRLYSSSWQCAVITARREGPRALYKGFWMNWLRIGPHTITTFLIFEQIRRWAGIQPV